MGANGRGEQVEAAAQVWGGKGGGEVCGVWGQRAKG